MKLRHFYKIDTKNKQPIPGSNIKRKSSPGKLWKEILDPCCYPPEVDCTCGPRFFVQVDGNGKPVPGTLIKRPGIPKMEENIKYMEINWKSPCCLPEQFFRLIWDFTNNSTGSLLIKVDGIEQVLVTASNNGIVVPPKGSLVEVLVLNECEDSITTTVDFTGGHTFSDDTGATEVVHNFLWNVNADVYLDVFLDCQQR